MLQNLAEQCKSLTPQANLFWLKVWHCSLCSPKTLELRQLRLHCHSWRFDPAFICLSPDCHISINRLPYKKESDIWSYVYKCKDRIPWPPPQHAAVGGMLDVWTGWLGKSLRCSWLESWRHFQQLQEKSFKQNADNHEQQASATVKYKVQPLCGGIYCRE